MVGIFVLDEVGVEPEDTRGLSVLDGFNIELGDTGRLIVPGVVVTFGALVGVGGEAEEERSRCLVLHLRTSSQLLDIFCLPLSFYPLITFPSLLHLPLCLSLSLSHSHILSNGQY